MAKPNPRYTAFQEVLESAAWEQTKRGWLSRQLQLRHGHNQYRLKEHARSRRLRRGLASFAIMVTKLDPTINDDSTFNIRLWALRPESPDIEVNDVYTKPDMEEDGWNLVAASLEFAITNGLTAATPEHIAELDALLGVIHGGETGLA